MYSVQIATSDGTLTRIELSIQYFAKDDISLYRNTDTAAMVLGVDWEWDGDYGINLLKGPEAAASVITVRRTTDKDRAYNIYDGGAAFNRESLDENFRQMIYLAQEFTEGNGLDGLYRALDMHGYRIINLGAGIDAGDAVNKGQLDAVDGRVSSIENSFITSTVSYPWRTVTTVATDVITPPFKFTKAAVYLNGLCQTPDYSYVVVDNQILLADYTPAGTRVFVRLGEDTEAGAEYATAEQLGNSVSALQAAKANAGDNSDITSLSGLTTALTVSQGGTGSTTVAGARAALAAANSGVNTDITQLSGLSGGVLGVVTGTAASTGIVGEQLSAVTTTAVTLATGTVANIVTLNLPAGDWEINCNVQLMNSAAVTSRSFGVSTATATLPTNWYERYSTTASLTVGTTNIAGIPYRLLLSASTTVYLVASVVFSGTCTAHGQIRARRMR